MHHLRIISCGDTVATWPCPIDVHVAGLVRALDTAAQWLRRFGSVAVVLDEPSGVTTVIRRWGKL
jgi:hypothetical protein